MLPKTQNFPAIAVESNSPGRTDSALPRLAREPLLHFSLLGGLVFLLYGIMVPKQQANLVAFDDGQRRELIVMFEQEHSRSPNADELQDMVARWVNNELLYREGVSLELDRSDSTIREMVISKTRALIHSRIVVPAPSEEHLHRFFDERADTYGNPEVVTVTQYIVRPSEADPAQVATELRRQLESGGAPERSYLEHQNKPASYFATVFGSEFASSLFDLPPREWRILTSMRGQHVVKVESKQAANARSFAEVRGTVLKDWTEQERKRQYGLALTELRAKYRVELPNAGELDEHPQ